MFRNGKLLLKAIDIKVFMLTMVAVTFLSPYIQRTIGTAGTLFLIGICFLLELKDITGISVHDRNTFLLICLYIGMLLLYTVLGISDTGGGQTNTVLFFMSYMILVPIYRSLERRHCVFVITACIIAMLFTIAQNYALWIKMGFRLSQQWYRIGIKEVVNTQYVFAIVLLSGVMLSVFLYKKVDRYRYLYLLVAVICFAFNLMVAQRAISLLLSIIMLMLLFLVNGRITSNKVIRYFTVAVILVVFVLEYQALLSWIANNVSSERIRQRINSINALLTTRDVSEVDEGSLTVRLRLINTSINTFFGSLSNFFFGVGDKVDNLLVGNHSYLFDEFAKFGIFGGLLSVFTILNMLKSTVTISAVAKHDPLYKLLFTIFIVFGLRSPIGGILAPSIGAMMFIMVPLVFRTMEYDTIRS